jgi:hypothetical protein
MYPSMWLSLPSADNEDDVVGVEKHCACYKTHDDTQWPVLKRVGLQHAVRVVLVSLTFAVRPLYYILACMGVYDCMSMLCCTVCEGLDGHAPCVETCVQQ